LWALIKVVDNPLGKAGQRRASEMQVAEASVVIPLSPEETWDLVFSDMQQAVELVPDVVSVEDFQIRYFSSTIDTPNTPPKVSGNPQRIEILVTMMTEDNEKRMVYMYYF
jgi:hypothetical protein